MQGTFQLCAIPHACQFPGKKQAVDPGGQYIEHGGKDQEDGRRGTQRGMSQYSGTLQQRGIANAEYLARD